VINVTYSDHLASVQAIVKGLKPTSVFLHTSGAGALVDGAAGQHGPTRVYSDLDQESLRTIDVSRPHRQVDNFLQSLPNVVIIVPPIVYGVSRGIKTISVAIPLLVLAARQMGFAVHIGRGLNVWSTIHVGDLARAYGAILSAAPDQQRGYYLTADPGKEVAYGDLARAIGGVLHQKGVIAEGKASEAPDEVAKKDSKGMMGGNAVTEPKRLQAIGWNVQDGTRDILDGDGLQEEIEEVLKVGASALQRRLV
jgi:uncharacterized protein YbjT (DUF2867 family)